jgi:hypothetical protein
LKEEEQKQQCDRTGCEAEADAHGRGRVDASGILTRAEEILYNR